MIWTAFLTFEVGSADGVMCALLVHMSALTFSIAYRLSLSLV